jgi:hypothetical protein
MDISSGYIVMCATPELQEEIPLESLMLGDYVAITVNDSDDGSPKVQRDYNVGRLASLSLSELNKEIFIEDFSILEILDTVKAHRPTDFIFVRLYEQDTLQDLLMAYCDYSMFRAVVEFNYFFMYELVCEDGTFVFDTLEKCWLAFFMWKAHRKRFDGKRWVLYKK